MSTVVAHKQFIPKIGTDAVKADVAPRQGGGGTHRGVKGTVGDIDRTSTATHPVVEKAQAEAQARWQAQLPPKGTPEWAGRDKRYIRHERPCVVCGAMTKARYKHGAVVCPKRWCRRRFTLEANRRAAESKARKSATRKANIKRLVTCSRVGCHNICTTRGYTGLFCSMECKGYKNMYSDEEFTRKYGVKART